MKRLKDPIYGYIDIPNDIVEGIIDTAAFQRLRSIVQTSYAPLYASAVHNRFVHSLGVFHLGSLVSTSFEKSLEENNLTCISEYIEIFKYACLLHDVGHAPFSHTGEEFYLGADSSRASLHDKIVALTNDPVLSEEIKLKSYAAAPHELMSVVVALNSFPALFATDEQRSFFARCILGYQYINNVDKKRSFLNCMISMLNSSVIDVDKLDYLIRDAYITGFDTVSIDYVRLLHSVQVICEEDTCKLVYLKGAISVIENVVFAHDAERKWIQSHPVVLYDAYLLSRSLESLHSKYDVFNYEALTVEGKSLDGNMHISLLNDGDITFLMKNTLSDSSVAEYFSRKDRRHPLWKSEAEYKAIFGMGFNDRLFQTVENELEELQKYLNFTTKSREMNTAALDALNADIQSTQELLSAASTPEKQAKIKTQLATKQKHLKWLMCFKEFADQQNIDFDFVIIQARQFNSGFGKLAFEKIEIAFPALKHPCNFKKVTNALSATKSDRDKFYYLFIRRKDREQVINSTDLAVALGTLAMQEAFSN